MWYQILPHLRWHFNVYVENECLLFCWFRNYFGQCFCCWLGHLKMSFNYPTSHGRVIYSLYINLWSLANVYLIRPIFIYQCELPKLNKPSGHTVLYYNHFFQSSAALLFISWRNSYFTRRKQKEKCKDLLLTHVSRMLSIVGFLWKDLKVIPNIIKQNLT